MQVGSQAESHFLPTLLALNPHASNAGQSGIDVTYSVAYKNYLERQKGKDAPQTIKVSALRDARLKPKAKPEKEPVDLKTGAGTQRVRGTEGVPDIAAQRRHKRKMEFKPRSASRVFH